MTVKARSATSAILAKGDAWVIDVRVYDTDGAAVDDTLTVTVTDPNGVTSTPTLSPGDTGRYTATVVVDAADRWIAQATSATYGRCSFTALVADATPAAQMPSLVDLDDYLGSHKATDDELEEALAAETWNQARMCRIPAEYTPDLRSALLRRCARHLAMKRIPLAVLQGDAETGSTVPPSRDSEVRRFEGPYRRLVMG